MKPRKKRNKPYRPRQLVSPMLVGSRMAFHAIEEIIDSIESDGTIKVTDRYSVPVHYDRNHNAWVNTEAAVASMIEHLEMHEIRHGARLPLDSMREFAKCLHYDMPVSDSLLARLKADVSSLQRIMSFANPHDASDLVVQHEIKNELRARGVA